MTSPPRPAGPARWTAGPWSRNIKPARKYPVVFSGRNKHVAIVCERGLSDAEIEANCDLITAAPALYEALKAMLARYDFADVLPADHPVVAARAALRAAEGGEG